MDLVIFLRVSTYVYFSLTSDVDLSFVESLIYSLRHILSIVTVPTWQPQKFLPMFYDFYSYLLQLYTVYLFISVL